MSKNSPSIDKKFLSNELQRLKIIFDLSPDCVFVKDKEFRLLMVNKALAKSMNASPKEMENRFDFEFWPKEKCVGRPEEGIRGYHDDELDAFAGTLTKVRETLVSVDAIERTFETTRVPLADEAGLVYGVLGISRDVTNDLLLEQKESELEKLKSDLIKSDERYYDLFNNAADGIITTDSEGVIYSFNYAAEKLFGFNEKEVIGKNVKMLVGKELRSQHDGFIQDYHVHGKSFIIGTGREVVGVHKDGSVLELYVAISVSERSGQKSFMAMVHNMSDVKIAEQLLLERESNFQLFANSSFEAIVIHDHGVVINANNQFFELFQYTREELIGKQAFDTLVDADSLDIVRRYLQVLSSKSYELVCIKKDGVKFPVEVLERDEVLNGKTVRATAIRDITEHKNNEEKLKVAKDQAEHANMAKSNFISSMSHELRTPLNAVIGYSQLFKFYGGLPEEIRNGSEEILKAGNHLLDLINDILDFERIESGMMDININVMSINELLKMCVMLVAASAEAQGITVLFHEAKEEDNFVYADKVRLRQIVINLLSNAIKYNQVDGIVVISVEQKLENNISIKISDTGVGIPKDKMDKLFEPFSRLGVERSNIQGTGIGLAISKQLAENMNGSITLQSTLGQGTHFYINLPYSTKPSVNQNKVSNDGVKHEKNISEITKILYVEDSISSQKLLTAVMRTRNEFDLSIAESAEVALALMKESIPHMILLDIDLPGMDGYEFLKYLKSLKRYKDIPVIAVTAKAMLDDLDKASLVRFEAYITKPIILNDLFKAIEQSA